MTKRYRLTARAEMFGAIHDPGFEFTLPEGEIGPHRTVSRTLRCLRKNPRWCCRTSTPRSRPISLQSRRSLPTRSEAHAKLTAVDGALKA